MTNITELVSAIRKWEMDAGESYCDYFFDRFSYDGKWNNFLLSKGFKELVDEIEYESGESSFGCTDQQLKFEPYSSAADDWSEEVYRLDVALWAEFILNNPNIFEEHVEFVEEYFQSQ